MRAVKFTTTEGAQLWVNSDRITAIEETGTAGETRVYTFGPTWTVRGNAWVIAKRAATDIVYGSPFEKRDSDQEKVVDTETAS